MESQLSIFCMVIICIDFERGLGVGSCREVAQFVFYSTVDEHCVRSTVRSLNQGVSLNFILELLLYVFMGRSF